MKGDILVLSEHRSNAPDPVTQELLGKARHIADMWGTRVGGLLMGAGMAPVVGALQHSGADVLLVADDPSLERYHPEVYTEVIENAVRRFAPALILMGYTYLGMETGPAVSVRMGGTLVTHCIDLNVEDDAIAVTRPMFAGTLHTVLKLKGPPPYFVSIEKGVLPKAGETRQPASVEAIPVSPLANGPRCKILELISPPPAAVDITQANILVSVGRGIQSPDKLSLVKDLAEALGGAVACSRPVADMGWLPEAHQVGISAKTVTPQVYIACGISGASQHVTAMRDSGLIIAINKDPNAPIFRVADYGYVGDLFDILPEMIKQARRAPVEIDPLH